jgi:hypothetical protein
MSFVKFIFSILVLAFTIKVYAQDIETIVPRTELDLKNETSTTTEQNQYLELQISSWAPRALSASSQLSDTSDYSKIDSAHFALSFGHLFYQGSAVDFSWKTGFSYLQMKRIGHLSLDTDQFGESEKLNLYQFSGGVEVTTREDLIRDLKPAIDLALVPTWEQSSSSQFSSGTSSWSWMARTTAGLVYTLPRFASWVGLQSFAVEAGVEVSKSLDQTNLDGTGAWAGSRIIW